MRLRKKIIVASVHTIGASEEQHSRSETTIEFCSSMDATVKTKN